MNWKVDALEELLNLEKEERFDFYTLRVCSQRGISKETLKHTKDLALTVCQELSDMEVKLDDYLSGLQDKVIMLDNCGTKEEWEALNKLEEHVDELSK